MDKQLFKNILYEQILKVNFGCFIYSKTVERQKLVWLCLFHKSNLERKLPLFYCSSIKNWLETTITFVNSWRQIGQASSLHNTRMRVEHSWQIGWSHTPTENISTSLKHTGHAFSPFSLAFSAFLNAEVITEDYTGYLNFNREHVCNNQCKFCSFGCVCESVVCLIALSRYIPTQCRVWLFFFVANKGCCWSATYVIGLRARTLCAPRTSLARKPLPQICALPLESIISPSYINRILLQSLMGFSIRGWPTIPITLVVGSGLCSLVRVLWIVLSIREINNMDWPPNY